MNGQPDQAQIDRARDLLNRNYTTGRVAEMTGLSLGQVDKLAGPNSLQPITGPHATGHTVTAPARVPQPTRCKAMLCDREPAQDGWCMRHREMGQRVAATAAIAKVSPPKPTPPRPAPKRAAAPKPPRAVEPPTLLCPGGADGEKHRWPKPADALPQSAWGRCPDHPKTARAKSDPRPCEADGCTNLALDRRPVCAMHRHRMATYGSYDVPDREYQCPIGPHTYRGPFSRAGSLRRCPEHLAQAKSTTRIAHCAEGHDFETPRRRGPAPTRCPEHRVGLLPLNPAPPTAPARRSSSAAAAAANSAGSPPPPASSPAATASTSRPSTSAHAASTGCATTSPNRAAHPARSAPTADHTNAP